MKHFSKILSSTIKKKLLFAALLSLASTTSYASYFHNNFMDEENSPHANMMLESKSDRLPLNIFDEKWHKMPPHNKENSAYGKKYFDIYYNFKNLKFGFFGEENVNMSVNDGFIQTWYQLENDFMSLLDRSNIGSSIDNVDINGNLNYHDSYGVFLQHVLPFNKHSFFSMKYKLYYAKEIQYIKVNGYNESDRFELSLDYYYANKNSVSNNRENDNEYSGLGYGVDLEYIFDNNDLYIYGAILNIGSFIEWKSISYMHYDFDSQTKYLGDDGYYHLKAFGNGYYKYDVNFKQKIPMHYKATVDYRIYNDLFIGANTNITKELQLNELYFAYEADNNRYKIGYVLENERIVLGAYFKYLSFSFSNKLSKNEQILQVAYHIKY